MTEILIAMGLMTLGLLGVLSIFPVGSYYMLQADVADQGSAVGQAVMNDLVARGMLDPNTWRIVATTPTLAGETANMYTRAVGPSIEAWQKAGLTPWQLAQRAGSVYVLDPIAIAGASLPVAAPANKYSQPFPAEASLLPSTTYNSCGAWQPWLGNSDYWPIRRVTFLQANTNRRMDSPLAWSLFSASSDLSIEHPSSGDQPAMQLMNLKAGAPLSRQSIGDYSFIVTIVPTTPNASQTLGRGGDDYVVSVVVFYKRGLPYAAPTTNTIMLGNLQDLQAHERIVKARIISSGPSGGEVLIADANTGQANPFQELRAGQWVMFCGPQPIMESAPTNIVQFSLGWYQVQAIDEDGTGVTNFDPATMRLLSLRGPEWLWRPATGGLADNAALSNNLCVGIFPGAVAVHTKTMRLQSAPQ